MLFKEALKFKSEESSKTLYSLSRIILFSPVKLKIFLVKYRFEEYEGGNSIWKLSKLLSILIFFSDSTNFNEAKLFSFNFWITPEIEMFPFSLIILKSTGKRLIFFLEKIFVFNSIYELFTSIISK